MAQRRLAEDSVQPSSFAFTKENAAWAKKSIARYPKGRQQSAVILLLMRAQDQEGWVSRAAIEKVAGMLDMAFIRVLEVATFYTQYQLKPVGTRAHIQVCGTTPCMLRGSDGLIAVCKSKINAHPHEPNADGTLSWEEVECMGTCVNAPMVAIRHDTYEDLTEARLEEIIDAFAEGKGDTLKTGSQIDRLNSAPVTGMTTLLDVPVRRPARKASAASKETVSKTAAAKPATAKKAPAKKSTAAAKPTGTALFETPEGAVDDLKLISGVGPVLEKKLNGFGVTQFAQVAKFKKADITALDDALSFKGRIERDDWVKQAKALAKGEDEYVRVFGKKPR